MRRRLKQTRALGPENVSKSSRLDASRFSISGFGFLILVDAKAMLCYIFLTEMASHVKKRWFRAERVVADLFI